MGKKKNEPQIEEEVKEIKEPKVKKSEPKKAEPKINELIISKEELLSAVPAFIEQYHRLPYMDEDDVIIEVVKEKKESDGTVREETIEQPYKALKYVRGHFGSEEGMTEYLLENEIITLKMISEYIDISEKRITEMMTGDLEKINPNERRRLHIFFNKDFYEKLGHINSLHCSDCTKQKQCAQPYWVSVISCPKFKKKSAKK